MTGPDFLLRQKISWHAKPADQSLFRPCTNSTEKGLKQDEAGAVSRPKLSRHMKHVKKQVKKRIHSNFLSRLLRPILENRRRIRLIIGSELAAAIIFVGILGPIGGNPTVESVEVTVLSPQAIKVLTETTFRVPVELSNGYSQGFRRFHPGVDIRSPRGTNVYPVANGTVAEVEIARFGYGHKVLVEHESGLTTLYAHLDAVSVKTGDKVTKETILGQVGMTGWTTGPHLHFEVHTPSGAINPRQVLPEPAG